MLLVVKTSILTMISYSIIALFPVRGQYSNLVVVSMYIAALLLAFSKRTDGFLARSGLWPIVSTISID